MKSLKEYFIYEDKQNIENYVIVKAEEPFASKMLDEYSQFLVMTDHGNYFILPKLMANKIKNNKLVEIFEVPKNYNRYYEVEFDLVHGKLDTPKMKQLKKIN